MKIALGNDHAGFRYKEKVKELLGTLGHEVKDFGTFSEEPVDYPLFIRPAAEAVARGECERGIAVRDGARDMVVDPGLVAADIELVEPQRVGRGLGEVLEAWIADRAEHVPGSEFASPAHHGFGYTCPGTGRRCARLGAAMRRGSGSCCTR